MRNTREKSPLLKDIAYKKIKELVLNEHFEAGQLLSERELIDILSMSKTPIKSALVRLESEGFVKISSKQGIYINDLSLQRITDIYDLRTALETFNCRKLLGKLSDEQFEKLKANLDATEKVVNNLDVQGFAEYDHAFHLLLSEFVNNHEIHRILLNYHDHLQRITFRHLRKDPNRMRIFWEEHVEIYEYLRNGDINCVEAMEKHLQDSKIKLFI